MNTNELRESNNSTKISDLNLIIHNCDNYIMRPTKNVLAEYTAKHFHVYHEIFFSVNSPITLITDFNSKKYFHKIIIVPPWFKHYAMCEENSNYSLSVTQNKKPEHKLLNAILPSKITIIDIDDDMLFYLNKLSKIDHSKYFEKLQAESLLKLIFLKIQTLLPKTTNNNDETYKAVDYKYNYVEKIENFIAKNFNNSNLSIYLLKKELNLSTRQIFRIIRKNFGCSFTELINEKKMITASDLLINSNFKINEIIEKLNFENSNYFFRLFKQKYGITPLQYRLKYNYLNKEKSARIINVSFTIKEIQTT